MSLHLVDCLRVVRPPSDYFCVTSIVVCWTTISRADDDFDWVEACVTLTSHRRVTASSFVLVNSHRRCSQSQFLNVSRTLSGRNSLRCLSPNSFVPFARSTSPNKWRYTLISPRMYCVWKRRNPRDSAAFLRIVSSGRRRQAERQHNLRQSSSRCVQCI